MKKVMFVHVAPVLPGPGNQISRQTLKNCLIKLAIGIIFIGLTGTFQSCKEKKGIPVVTTAEITAIAERSAVSGGTITDDGGAAVHTRGIAWSLDPQPFPYLHLTNDGTGTGTFTSSITGLIGNTTYYVRAFAFNSEGVGYGTEVSFKTSPVIIDPSIIVHNTNLTYGSVTDVEGNTYKTIQIGNQEWMAENLRTTKYNDGTAIPLEPLHEPSWISWTEVPGGAYCWYNSDEGLHRLNHGAIYNFKAVETGKLCPSGWKVPDLSQWNILRRSLGSDSTTGNKLRETGTAHWDSPNKGATNETGFTAVPGGYLKMVSPYFRGLGTSGQWWSASVNAKGKYGTMEVATSSVKADFTGAEHDGYMVRCIKN